MHWSPQFFRNGIYHALVEDTELIYDSNYIPHNVLVVYVNRDIGLKFGEGARVICGSVALLLLVRLGI